MSLKINNFKAAASDLLKIGRSSKGQADHGDEQLLMTLPLSLVIASNNNNSLLGCFYLRKKEGGEIGGEMAIQLAATSDSFKSAMPTAIATETPVHQQYLTLHSGPHQWQRLYAYLHQRTLFLNNPQRQQSSQLAPVSLAAMINVRFMTKHACGLENVLTMTFENDQVLLAYADDEKQGLEWADAVSKAVWNQPYVV